MSTHKWLSNDPKEGRSEQRGKDDESNGASAKTPINLTIPKRDSLKTKNDDIEYLMTLIASKA